MTYSPQPWIAKPQESSGIYDYVILDANDEGVADIVLSEASEDDARLVAAAPTMAEALLWIRENLHPKILGRAATDAELLAITYATKVLRQAGVIPTPVLKEATKPSKRNHDGGHDNG